MVMRDDELRRMLEEAFGDYTGSVVHVEQRVIDADVDRLRNEERRWQQHADQSNGSDAVLRAALDNLAEVRAALVRVRVAQPNCGCLTELEYTEGRAALSCRHSAQDKYIRDGEIACSECDEMIVRGEPRVRYTMVVWREHAEAA